MIVIESIAGLATIQDLGRPGRMHEALPPGGALVPELLAIANRAAGNSDGAAAIEVFGRIRIRAETDVVVGTLRRVVLRAGDEIVVESGPWRVAYVALRGGIDEPIVLGGRGAHLSAGIGRRLRPNDRLAASGELLRAVGALDDRSPRSHLGSGEPLRAIGAQDDRPTTTDLGRGAPLRAVGAPDDRSPRSHLGSGEPFRAIGAPDDRLATTDLERAEPIRVIAGPDRIAGALEALCSGEYEIAPASDRVGTRLIGPVIGERTSARSFAEPLGSAGLGEPKERPSASKLAVSRPMTRGAIEIPPDGAPIVLGPEHPTTGGYPVIGVIASADLGRFFARPIAGHVRFISVVR